MKTWAKQSSKISITACIYYMHQVNVFNIQKFIVTVSKNNRSVSTKIKEFFFNDLQAQQISELDGCKFGMSWTVIFIF